MLRCFSRIGSTASPLLVHRILPTHKPCSRAFGNVRKQETQKKKKNLILHRGIRSPDPRPSASSTAAVRDSSSAEPGNHLPAFCGGRVCSLTYARMRSNLHRPCQKMGTPLRPRFYGRRHVHILYILLLPVPACDSPNPRPA